MTIPKKGDGVTPVMMNGDTAGPAAAADRDSTTIASAMAVKATPNTTRPVRALKERPTPVKADETRIEGAPKAEPVQSASAPAESKLDRLLGLLRKQGGATIADLAEATGWQAHSVRGAMAGALRKKGHTVLSDKPADGPRRYRIAELS